MTAVRGTVSDEAILETVRTFVGVEHRNQWVATVDGVHYNNNSIGSSPARTVATLHAHWGRVLLSPACPHMTNTEILKSAGVTL